MTVSVPSDGRDLISDLYYRSLGQAARQAAFLIEASGQTKRCVSKWSRCSNSSRHSARLLERSAVAVADSATSMPDGGRVEETAHGEPGMPVEFRTARKVPPVALHITHSLGIEI